MTGCGQERNAFLYIEPSHDKHVRVYNYIHSPGQQEATIHAHPPPPLAHRERERERLTIYLHSRSEALLKPACLAPVSHVLAHRTVPSQLAFVLLAHLHRASEEALAGLTANDTIVPSVRAIQRRLLAAHSALKTHQRPAH